MLDTAVQSLKSVDLVLLVIDIEQPFGRGDEHVLDLVKKAECPVVLGINKIDARKKHDILPLIERYRHLHDFADIVPFSALMGDNVDRLEEVLVSHLPQSEPLYPEETLTDLPERFFVSEMVREKILRLTRHEVPHSTAVIIDTWDEEGELTPHRSDRARRARLAKGDPRRKGRCDDEEDRDCRPRGRRGVFGDESLSRAPRQGPRRLAGQQAHPLRSRIDRAP